MEDQDKLKQLVELQEIIEFGADKEEIEQLFLEYQLKSMQDLQKNIMTLNMKIERTKQKILVANTMDEVDEPPPVKQTKYSKMIFENEVAQQSFLENVKKMVGENRQSKCASGCFTSA